MTKLISRRFLLQSLGTLSIFALGGCSDGRSDDNPTSHHPLGVEPRITPPVRVQGEPIAVHHNTPLLNESDSDNSSVGSRDGANGKSSSPKAAFAHSVYLADNAIRDVLVQRLDDRHKYVEAEWSLQWEEAQARFLFTTTTVIEFAAADVKFPSYLYAEIKSKAPKKVTVIIATNEESIFNEFPVFIRARLRLKGKN